jgi:hypothetical protein
MTALMITGGVAYVDFDLDATCKTSVAIAQAGKQGALFTFSLDNSPYVESYFVPGVLPTLLTGKEVIVDSGAGQAFAAAITAGLVVGATTIQPCNKFSFDCVALLSALYDDR